MARNALFGEDLLAAFDCRRVSRLASKRKHELGRIIDRRAGIGRRLHLSGKTVATHKYRLLDKLAIKDTVSLARLATQYGVHDANLAPP